MKNRMQELAGISNVAYSGVVLDEESREKILDRFGSIIPNGWEIIVHHATINLGPLDPQYGYEVGDEVTMKVSGIGISTKAIAVKVDIKTKNDIPHVTVAIDRKGGAKPFDSNKITDWKPVEEFNIKGTVEEVLK